MGAQIHPDVKRAAVRLSEFFSPQMVAYFLSISEDTVCRSVKLYEETGDVVNPVKGAKRGRKPLLNEGEREVSLSWNFFWYFSSHGVGMFSICEGLLNNETMFILMSYSKSYNP
jgi:hypothetical protein